MLLGYSVASEGICLFVDRGGRGGGGGDFQASPDIKHKGEKHFMERADHFKSYFPSSLKPLHIRHDASPLPNVKSINVFSGS